MCTIEDIKNDFAIIEDLCEQRKPKFYKDRFCPFELDDDDFYSRYRLDKISTRFLISLLDVSEPKNNRGLPISKDLQVLTTLRFLGRNANQSDIVLSDCPPAHPDITNGNHWRIYLTIILALLEMLSDHPLKMLISEICTKLLNTKTIIN